MEVSGTCTNRCLYVGYIREVCFCPFAGASILVSFPDFESQAMRQIWEGFGNQATAILLCGKCAQKFQYVMIINDINL